jgi:hypothetical protein
MADRRRLSRLRMAAPATQPTTISDVSGSGTFAGTDVLHVTRQLLDRAPKGRGDDFEGCFGTNVKSQFFCAQAVVPLMQEQGTQEEEAAISLGASGLQTFFRVTLPNVKWALLYGVILCNARAMGEFGAVSVVSGHIRGKTNTIPLHVEILYNEYNFVAAFSVASLLALLALLTLVAKSIVEARMKASSEEKLEPATAEE